MKATGIVRIIDDLGKVVVPKEIRRMLRIREGDPLEIFMDKDCVVYRKYNEIESLESLVKPLAQSAFVATNRDIIITDETKVLAYAGMLLGPAKRQVGKDVSQEFVDIFFNENEDTVKIRNLIECVNFVPEDTDYFVIVQPIKILDRVVGSVSILSDRDDIDLTDLKFCKFYAQYIAHMMKEE